MGMRALSGAGAGDVAGEGGSPRPQAGPFPAIARQTLRDARTRTITVALLFLWGAAAQGLAYPSAYPTVEDRLKLAHSFGDNQAVRLLYGVPHDLLTVGGYMAWRLGALTIFAALFVLAAVRAFRAEEEAGRQDLVFSGVVGRTAAFNAALVGIAASALIVWLALFAGVLTGRESAGDSAYLALALMTPVPVFVGVGALASQIAPTRRTATAIGSAVLGGALLLRMTADTTSAGWLRWVTPLGWAEELRPFTGARPLVLLLPLAATLVLLVAGARIATTRDIGRGLLAGHDSAPPRMALLSSPTSLALRTLRGGLLGWLTGIAVFALLMGVISDSVASGLSQSLQDQLEKLGTAANTATGYLGFAFLFFLLALSPFACFQLAAMREDEAEQRLETLLALPVRRGRWFLERLALVVAMAAGLALVAGLLAWVGAASQGAGVAFGRMVEAGANCLPVVVLFLGLGAVALALVPRAGTTIAYSLVGATFLWETIGGLVSAPRWALGLSPFHHVGLVPAEAFRATGALAMLAIGLVAAVAAAWIFDRRDVVGA
jgi:polyether ionophore transport system permease protein